MNDRQLNSFIRIVETGSFSKAEDILFLSKQALKKQMDALEEEVGFALIRRTRHGIELTDGGEVFFRGAKRILSEIETVTQRSREIASDDRVIRIDNPNHPRLLLENAFDEFAKRYPNVRQQIRLQDTEHLIDDILNDYADIAECIYHKKYDTVPGLAVTKLFPAPYKCLMASSHPLANSRQLTIDALSGCTLFVLRRNRNLIYELMEKCANTKVVYLDHNDTQEIMSACYSGAIFISKAYYLDSMKPLLAVPLETEHTPMAAILHRDHPTPVARDFIDTVLSLYPQKN